MTYLEIIKGLTYLNIKGNLEQEFVGKVRIDSRKIGKGDIFVAIPGTKVDGHQFIENAITSLAGCIVCQKEVEVPDNVLMIVVPDTQKCLLQLATIIRTHYSFIPVIAVTGSLGKTTTKELIYSILSKKYKVLKNEGNQNNHIGVPLTLFELDDSYDICVLELGMNHLNEIHELSCCCCPNISIITNIGTSHIGNLGSKKNILKAKLEIIDGMSNGTLILNGDDTYLKRISSKKVNILTCGLKSKNDITATDVLCTKNHLYFNTKILGKYYPIIFSIPNLGYIYNILFSIVIGYQFQVPIEDMVEAIKTYQVIGQRSEIIPLVDNILLIDDSYNSSLESLKNGLKMLDYYDQEKIVILGDILELGEYSANIHQKIKKELKKYNKTILIGEEIKRACHKDTIWCKSVDDAMNYLDTLDLKNKLIYIKGSNKMQLWKIANKLKDEYVIKKV